MIAPAVAKATRIPVVADELCRTAVITAPAMIPKYHLEPTVDKISLNIGEAVKGFIAALICPIPTNRIPKPNIMLPMSFLFLRLANITINAPKKTNNGAI